MSGMKLLAPVGTLPEAVKLTPIIRRFSQNKIDLDIVVTSQATPDVLAQLDGYNVVHRGEAKYPRGLIAAAVLLFEEIRKFILGRSYAAILCIGDTSTALAAARVGKTRRIKTIHLESGMRSGVLTRPFPEEFIRRHIDKISDYRICFNSHDRENLVRESISADTIFSTQSPIYDAMFESMNILENSFMDVRDYVLVHLHRRELREVEFQRLIVGIDKVCKSQGANCLILKNRRFLDVNSKPLSCTSFVDVMSHVKFIELLKGSSLIVTDSGTLQEEAWALGKRALIMRRETERPYLLNDRVSLMGRSIDFDIIKSCIAVKENNSKQIHIDKINLGGSQEIVEYIKQIMI